jgi:hypothetical protein
MAIRLIANISSTTNCKPYLKKLKIMTLPCIYIYEILLYIKMSLSNQKFKNQQMNCILTSKSNAATLFRLQQAIFSGSKFYICSTSISSFISTSYINTKQILYSQWIRTPPTSAIQIYKIQGMSCTYVICIKGGVLIHWELRICFVLMNEVLMNELIDVEHM